MQHRSVIVVGAGPVGLTCALALQAQGIAATVLEAEPEDRVRPGSRAIFTHGASLRLLEAMHPGLGRELARRGVMWSTKRTFWRGREVFARTYPPPRLGTLPPFTSLPQTEVENILLAACRAFGVEVVWNNAVQQVRSSPSGVHLTLAGGAQWTAGYVIGADGARYTVRREIGVTMEGERSESTYVIVDVEADPNDPRPAERHYHYEHPAVGGRNVLLVPFAGGWRADLQCRRDDDASDFSSAAGARAWVGAVLGREYGDRIAWVSTYRFLQVVATALTDTDQRVLLAGEAGHLFAPFGARGLNSGIADADAAARAIRAALDIADPAAARTAIARFAADRLEAAERNRRAAASALAATESDQLWDRARRRIAGRLAPRSARAASWLDSAPYGPRLREQRGGAKAGY
jgi:3-(3-hydroxy-phenyl)propionate hydroxylase